MSNFFKTLKDVKDVMMGKDLDLDIAKEVKKANGSNASKNSDTTEAKDSKKISESEISSEQLIDLLDYIGSEDLAKDFKELFRNKKPSADLKGLVDAANKVLGTNSLKDAKDDYRLEFNFIDLKTKERKNKQGEALLSSGVSLDQLKDFNLVLEVVRVDKETGRKVSDGTNEDIKKVENLLREQFSKDISKR